MTGRTAIRPGSTRKTGHKNLTVADATMLLLQLADLLDAGIAVVEALDVLAESSPHGGMASLGRDLQTQLLHGKPVSEALARHPRLFDAMTLILVRQSERAGTLADALRNAAGLWERRTAYRAAIRRALAYPIFVCCVSAGLMAGLMIWSVPAFAQLFASFDAPLPVLTRAIVALSASLRAMLDALLPSAVGLGGIAAIPGLLRRVSPLRGPIDAFHARWRTRAIRAAWYCADRLAPVARWRRDALFADWGMALAAMLDAGIPLHEALRALAAGHDHGHGGRGAAHGIADDTTTLHRELADRLARGQTLAQAMRFSNAFNEDALRLTAVAERSGALSRMLGTLARRRGVSVHARIERCIRWIEPVALLVCGAVVGVVIVALYLPIIKLGEVI
ncbi:type II secretion system F family protein [Robbsia sp. KACC 23696]|uniref:type II secretion system F family protein n=1 Tax=Robbsia sp. KACC 23696 TaxID=3149231 RepID=UPI00325A79B6